MKGSGCYNCPVKGCTAAYRGSRCAHLRELAGVDFDPMTNADHLQELSDEEKAHLLTQVFYQVAQQDNTEQHILEWLRNPVEVEYRKRFCKTC